MLNDIEDSYFALMFPNKEEEGEEVWLCPYCLLALGDFFNLCACGH